MSCACLTAFFVASRSVGNLWAFSTAKLESRGKRMKKLARKQTSNQKTSTKPRLIKKKRRGGKKSKHRVVDGVSYWTSGYAGNKNLSMVGRTTLREERLWEADDATPHHRRREQLSTIGKIKANPKIKQDECGVQARWGDKLPLGVTFTVLGLLTAMVSGKMQPLYTIDGKCTAPSPAS